MTLDAIRAPLGVLPILLALTSCDVPTEATAPRLPDGPGLDRAIAELPPRPVFVSAEEAAADPNPWFPLVPGAVWVYENESEDGLETTFDEITGDTRIVDGIEATVLRDEVRLNDQVIEFTFDWYAQDFEGNVWYLGETSCEWEQGSYQEGDELEEDCGEDGDPAGSWEAGVDGAEAGIIMWADPLAYKGKTYRQEYYDGEAEDMAKVLKGGLTLEVPAGVFDDCIKTLDFTPLDPGAREQKFYCAGYGLVLEVQPKGGREDNELVEYEGLPAIGGM